MKVFNMIWQNLLILAMAYCVYFTGEHGWYFKALLYILYPLSVLTFIYMFVLINKDKNNPVLEKRKSKIYMAVDIILDFVYIFVFILLDYKAIFVLHLITMILSSSLYYEQNKSVEEIS